MNFKGNCTIALIKISMYSYLYYFSSIGNDIYSKMGELSFKGSCSRWHFWATDNESECSISSLHVTTFQCKILGCTYITCHGWNMWVIWDQKVPNVSIPLRTFWSTFRHGSPLRIKRLAFVHISKTTKSKQAIVKSIVKGYFLFKLLQIKLRC